MATLRLPVKNGLPAYRFSVELDGVLYSFRFRWNVRDNHWFMDIIEADGSAVIDGVKVVNSDDLLSQFDHKQVTGNLPPGTFRVVDVNGANDDPDTTTFGEDVVLLYVEA